MKLFEAKRILEKHGAILEQKDDEEQIRRMIDACAFDCKYTIHEYKSGVYHVVFKIEPGVWEYTFDIKNFEIYNTTAFSQINNYDLTFSTVKKMYDFIRKLYVLDHKLTQFVQGADQ